MRSYDARSMPINQPDPVEGTRGDEATPCVKVLKTLILELI